MSRRDIDLNIDNLKAFNTRLDETLTALKTSRNACKTQVTDMNQAWKGPSYSFFREEAFFIINGPFLQSVDDVAAFRKDLRRTAEKASELRVKANGFLGILFSDGGAGSGSDTSILFHDASQVSTIRSTIASTESTISSLTSSVESVASTLSRMRTKSIYIDGGVINYYSGELKSRLSDLEASMDDFDSGLSDMATIINNHSANISGDRFVGSSGYESLLVDGSISDPEIALLLFRTPEHLLTDHEKNLLQELKDAGYTLEAVIGVQGMSIYSGIVIGTDLYGGLVTAGSVLDLAGTGFKAESLKMVGKGFLGVGLAFGVADAFYDYDQAFRLHPELATSRRKSDAEIELYFSLSEAFTFSALSYFIPEKAGESKKLGSTKGTVTGTAVMFTFASGYSIFSDEIQGFSWRGKGPDGKSLMDIGKDWYFDNFRDYSNRGEE